MTEIARRAICGRTSRTDGGGTCVTDLVEHPELVAERLVNYGRLVGMENLQGSTDCGIGSRVGHPEIVWAKLSAMAEGAALASKRLKAGL